MYIVYLFLLGITFSQDECCFGFSDECSTIEYQWECNDTSGCMWYCEEELETNFSDLPSFWLKNPYPNPFNPSTLIQYSISNISMVNISIYDLNGKQIDVLIKSEKAPGNYEIKWTPQNTPNGIYIVRMNVDGFNISRKLIYLK